MDFGSQFTESLWFYFKLVVFIHVVVIVFLFLKWKFIDKQKK